MALDDGAARQLLADLARAVLPVLEKFSEVVADLEDTCGRPIAPTPRPCLPWPPREWPPREWPPRRPDDPETDAGVFNVPTDWMEYPHQQLYDMVHDRVDLDGAEGVARTWTSAAPLTASRRTCAGRWRPHRSAGAGEAGEPQPDGQDGVDDDTTASAVGGGAGAGLAHSQTLAPGGVSDAGGLSPGATGTMATGGVPMGAAGGGARPGWRHRAQVAVVPGGGRGPVGARRAGGVAGDRRGAPAQGDLGAGRKQRVDPATCGRVLLAVGRARAG
jgi:hypothetical protein